jgi:drug/metabolite transporter (DMT)-like permease
LSFFFSATVIFSQSVFSSMEFLKTALLLLAGTATFVSYQFANKQAMGLGAEVLAVTWAALTFCACIVFLFMAAGGNALELSPKKISRDVLLVAAFMAAGNLLFLFGISRTSMTNANIIFVATAPLTAIFTSLLNRERLAKRFWLFSLLMLAGAVVASYKGSLTALTPGDLSVFASTACIALGNCFSSRALRRVSSEELTFWRFLIGSFFLFPVALVFGNIPGLLGNVDAAAFVAAGSALFAASVVFFFILMAAKGAAFASNVNLLHPGTSAVLDFAVLGITPSAYQVFGGALVVSAGYKLVRLTDGKKR